MQAESTNDISLEDLRDLSIKLGPEFELTIDEHQRFHKSASPPSWVIFFAEANWWIKLLGVYAGLYIAEIVKEAGKDTWKNRGTIIAALVAGGNRVKTFAVELGTLRSRLSAKTQIELGVPFPDNDDGIRFEVVGSEPDETALQVALFVHHLPQLMELLRAEGLSRSNIATGIQILLRPDLSLEVAWQDNESLKRQTRQLPFTPG